tara:strand:- start:187 stop:1110 length:924 start_codon:yes stop_codon:yes gene_type:complete
MIKKPKPWQKKYYPNKDGTPSVFYVETVLACNLACPECAIGVDVITRNKKILKLSEFEIISKKIEPYAKLVYLHKWGEPFMNKNIIPMIREVSKYAHPHISTNGHFLDEKNAEEVITSGLGTLIISIDGVTQETYDKYRVKGDVELVKENIARVAKINEKYGNPVDLLPQFIVFDHNYHEKDKFADFCKKINVRPIFKSPYIRFGSVKESNDKNFQRIKYNSKESHLAAISGCNNGDTTMTITADGSLLLCSQDYNKEWKLGSILDPDMTVPKLWNNPYYKKIRDNIINKNPPEICKKNCMFFNPGY